MTGYRIKDDSGVYNADEITSGLKADFIGRDCYYYDLLKSTNEIAFKMAKEGALHGTAVVADCQTAGKGRLGRDWHSPPGVNIYTSLILRPAVLPKDAPQLSMLAAVAALDSIRSFLPHVTSIKWPNDILIDSRKVSGVLAEMDAEGDKLRFVVVGVGINVNVARDSFPAELRPHVTSIKDEVGEEVSRVDLIKDLYLNLEKWYKLYIAQGFDPVREVWERYGVMEGKTVTIRQYDNTVEGVVVGLDNDGALLISGSGGGVSRVLAGDVSIN